MAWLPHLNSHLNSSPKFLVYGSSANVDSSESTGLSESWYADEWIFAIWSMILKEILHFLYRQISCLFQYSSVCLFQDFHHSLQIYWMKKNTPVKFHFSWHFSLYHSLGPIAAGTQHTPVLCSIFVMQCEAQSKFKGICCVISGVSKIHRYVLHLRICAIGPLRQDGKD